MCSLNDISVIQFTEFIIIICNAGVGKSTDYCPCVPFLKKKKSHSLIIIIIIIHCFVYGK